MKIDVSNGEFVDRLTILRIKIQNISDTVKQRHVKDELETMEALYSAMEFEDKEPLTEKLYAINRRLWDIENRIREKEGRKEFDDTFISLARSVYLTNDRRSGIKKQIDMLSGSKTVEEKSYSDYADNSIHPNDG